MNKFIGIIVVVLFLLQFSFLPAFGVESNLLLALVMILAQRRFDFSGIVWILICGILVDMFSARMFGVNTLSFVLLGLIINLANSFFIAFESNRVINSVIYFIGKVFFDVMKYYLGAVFVIIGITEFNAIIAPKVFSFGYVLSLIIFTIFAVILLIVYEKLEKISGEKRQRLIINKS